MNTKVKNSILKYLSVLLIFIFVLESLDLSVVFAGEQIGESWVHDMDTFYMALDSNLRNQIAAIKETNSGKTIKTFSRIKDNYISELKSRRCDDLEFERWGLTNMSVVYGPYIWLPKGEYTVDISFTEQGWKRFQCWDIGVASSAKSTDGYIPNNASGNIRLGEFGGCTITASKGVNSGNHHLTFTFTAVGDCADYEFRTFFWDNLGDGNFLGKDGYVTGMTVKRNSPTQVRCNPNGGTFAGSTGIGVLGNTWWGTKRGERVGVPTRNGYKFDGWYANSTYSNGGTSTNPNGDSISPKDSSISPNDQSLVKIWDANGYLVDNATVETNYFDYYTVFAHWIPDDSVNVIFHYNDAGLGNTAEQSFSVSNFANQRFGLKTETDMSNPQNLGYWTGNKVDLNNKSTFDGWTWSNNEILGWSEDPAAHTANYATYSGLNYDWVSNRVGKNIELYAVLKYKNYSITCKDYDKDTGEELGIAGDIKTYRTGSSVSGSAWGTDKTANKYHTGYSYDSCSKIDYVSSDGTVKSSFLSYFLNV